jgi:hypothetical protein
MRVGSPGWPLALAALLLGACAADDSQAAAPPSSRASAPAPPAPQTAPTPAPSPAAPAPAARKPAASVADFQWPDPLPAPAAEVPALFKGLIIGSWEPGEQGFDQEWIDERGLREAWTKSTASRRTWKGFAISPPAVPVDSLLHDREGPAVGYVFSLVTRADGDPEVEDAPAVLHVRHRGRVRVLVDGLPTLDAPAPAPGTWGEARAPIVLSGPYTAVLLKLGRGNAALGDSMNVEVRVSAPDGSPLPRQSWNTMRPGADVSGG